MKKKYDLIIKSNGCVVPMSAGLFEKVHDLANCSGTPFNPAEFIEIELPLCIYRIAQSDFTRPEVTKFLKRTEEFQNKRIEETKQ